MSITSMPDLDHVLALPAAEAVKVIHENPAWGWTVAHAITASAVGLKKLTISGGMGLPEGIVVLPTDKRQENEFIWRWKLACNTRVATWRGFDLRGIQGDHDLIGHIDIMGALDAGSQYLTESGFDFLMARDQKRLLGVYISDWARTDDGFRELMDYDDEVVRLSWDFRNQMIAEAAPERYHVAAGAYILEHTPLQAVDREVAWEALRLIIHPRGIFASILYDNVVMPLFWTPEGINTCQIYVHPRAVFALDAMLACIWRDACVVQERWSERYAAKQIVGKPPTEQDRIRSRQNKALILPRTVYRVSWAAEPERVAIQRRAYTAHAVTGSYPRLEEGKVYAGAAERAEEHGWPAPPPGRTFRKPHTRGEGTVDAEQQRPVVCKGLLIANMILN